MTNNQDCSDPSSDGDLPPGPTGNRTHDREGDRDRQRTKRGDAAPLHDREEKQPARDADERRDQESTTARRGDALSASEPTGHGPHMASYRCDPDRMRLGTTGDEQRNADGHRPLQRVDHADEHTRSFPRSAIHVRGTRIARALGRRIVGAHKASDELRGREVPTM